MLKQFLRNIVYISVMIFFVTSCQKKNYEILQPNNSYWAKTETIPVSESINKDLEVDFAIIGGGYTGLSTAYHLAKMHPELKIAVFEAKKVGNGASGKNGGMVLPVLLEEYTDLETLKWTYDVSVKNIRFIDSLAKAYDFDCNLTLNGYCETVVYQEDIKDYKDYAAVANKAGIPVEYWDKQKTRQMLGTDAYFGALYDPNGGSVHAMKLVHLLKMAAEDNGVMIYENSRVVDIKESENILLTVKGNKKEYKVKAKNIVLATNAFTSKLGFFKNKIIPVFTQTAVTEPLTDKQIDEIKWNSRIPYFDSKIILYHLVLTPDNRIVIGGGNIDYYYNNGITYKGNIKKVEKIIKKQLSRIYPQLKDVKIDYIWSGALGVTYDEVETVGVTGKNNNIFYAMGYNGHGVNQAILFGELIAYLYDSKYHEWQDTEYYGYKISKFPPEPFRFIGTKILFKYWKWQDRD